MVVLHVTHNVLSLLVSVFTAAIFSNPRIWFVKESFTFLHDMHFIILITLDLSRVFIMFDSAMYVLTFTGNKAYISVQMRMLIFAISWKSFY